MTKSLPELPIVVARGAPRDRGKQIGVASRSRVHRCLEIYEETFKHFAGLTWRDVRRAGLTYLPAIEAHDGEIAEEMAGIAAGSGVDEADIVALNARTEIMTSRTGPWLAECTSFAAVPPATTGDVWVGQNWDWRQATLECIGVFAIAQPGRPAVLMFTEAGLVGKIGMNSVGLGLAANLLLSSERGDAAGVPFHVLARSILNSPTFGDGVQTITRTRRAAAANFLIASRDGTVSDFETLAGGEQAAHRLEPRGGVLTHANTMSCDALIGRDFGRTVLPDSPLREKRLTELLTSAIGRIDLSVLRQASTDHENYPGSICRHPNPAEHPLERLATNAFLAMNLSARVMHICPGLPCEAGDLSIVELTFANGEFGGDCEGVKVGAATEPEGCEAMCD